MRPEYVDLVWLLDSILLSVVMALGVGTAMYTLVQTALARKRRFTLLTIQRHLRHLSTQPESVIKATIRDITAQLTLKQWLVLTKRPEQWIPEGLEEYWREALQTSEKVREIVALARHARNKWRRIEALVCLGYLQTSHALDVLYEGLQAPDEDISYAAVLALGQIKNSQSAALLLGFLSHNPFSGQKIVSLLETFPALIVDEILHVVEHPNAVVRFWAVTLLSKFKPEGCFERIQSLTADASPDVRAAACECLGNLGRREAEAVLLQRLRDEVWFVRMQAVRALAKVTGTQHMTAFLELLAQDDSSYVKASIKEIIWHDIDQAVTVLEQYLRQDNDLTKKYCVDALVDANYVSKICDDILSDDQAARTKAVILLEALIKSRMYFGLKRTVDVYAPEARQKIL